MSYLRISSQNSHHSDYERTRKEEQRPSTFEKDIRVKDKNELYDPFEVSRDDKEYDVEENSTRKLLRRGRERLELQKERRSEDKYLTSKKMLRDSDKYNDVRRSREDSRGIRVTLGDETSSRRVHRSSEKRLRQRSVSFLSILKTIHFIKI